MDGDSFSEDKRSEWEAHRELQSLGGGTNRIRVSNAKVKLERIRLNLLEMGLTVAAADVCAALRRLADEPEPSKCS